MSADQQYRSLLTFVPQNIIMKTYYKQLLALLIVNCQLPIVNPVQAQTITFDSEDYKAIGAYDSWEQSPLRDGRITPAVSVLPNHLTQPNAITGTAPNTTANIVGFQRSRYGGNLCGLRVDLKQTFRLTKEPRYVHVMINRPMTDSNVMLITLGKRSERADQRTDVEQTWSLSSVTPIENDWFDAVFEIKGFSYSEANKDGIDIYSLVICPDVTDRSQSDEDFVCYIDQIEITDQLTPRFATEYYAVSFDRTSIPTRTDRRLNGVTLQGGTYGSQSWNGLGTLFYNDGAQKKEVFHALAGDNVTPAFSYQGTWMSGYAYVDWAQDGTFDATLNNDGTPAEGSDVVSYRGCQVEGTWRNSLGEELANGNQITQAMPAFTIPQNTQPGIYRMRYKVDWNCIDPAGNSSSGNAITANGGGIADVLLNVCPEQTVVTSGQLNGDILLASTGEPLSNHTVKRGESLRIRIQPAPGFTHNGVIATYGYNLSGEESVKDNPQRFTVTLPATAFINNELTLPDSLLRMSQLSLEGQMVQDRIVEVKDKEVTGEKLETLELNGTSMASAKRTLTLQDNTHSLHQLPDDQIVGLTAGRQIESNTEGTLYVDLNRDGKFSAANEYVEGTLSSDITGIYRALWQTGEYQFLFVINLHTPTVTIITDITDGRIICRQKTVDGTMLQTTGVPTATDAYKFLGLIAQPIVDSYECTDATIRWGHNLGSEPSSDGLQQWQSQEVSIMQDGRINIPYYNMYGTVEIKVNSTPTEEGTMYLAFSDEFNGTTVDRDKWSTRPRATSTWNRFITDDPRLTFVQDGSLVCLAHRNDILPEDDAPMLTGMVQSANSYGMIHGYVEARVLTKPHSGNFPAFWMMPIGHPGGWPVCGEIDIWEMINTQHRTYHTVHSNWTVNLGNKSNPTSSANKGYQQDEWHTYGLLKQANKLTWYVDGTEVFSYAKSQNADHLEQGQWPYEKPFYIIMNQSVGDGSWASNYDASFVYETRFDWVRAYEYYNDPDGIVAPTAPAQSNTLYDLSGRPTNGKQPGIVISNGHKVIVK